MIRRIARQIVAGTALAGAALACGAPRAAADADPGAFGRELTRLIMSSDTAMLAELVERNYAEDLLEAAGGSQTVALAWLDERRRYGPLEYHSTGSEDGLPMLWLRGTRTGAWLGVKLSRTEEPSGANARITSVALRRGTSPPDLRLGEPLTDRLLADSLARYVETMAADGFFSGTVLVAREDEIIHASAHGVADPSTGRLNTLDTRFNVASTGKMFTGVALARLAESGRLSFDDPLSAHVPEYPERIADRVTVRSLLDHTSGIELDDHEAFQRATYASRSVEGLLRAQIRFLDSLPAYREFEPSGEFDYTNEGFNLAGAVIERTAGMPYAAYLLRFVFEPAGMHATGSDLTSTEQPVARGLTFEAAGSQAGDGERVPNDGSLPAMVLPAGGHYSTAMDLWRFARALAEHRLLGPAWTDSVTTMKVVEAELPSITYGYGYGFEVIERNGFRSYGHAGGMPGASTKFEVYPELDLTIIVLSNWDGTATMVTNHIRDLTLRR